MPVSAPRTSVARLLADDTGFTFADSLRYTGCAPQTLALSAQISQRRFQFNRGCCGVAALHLLARRIVKCGCTSTARYCLKFPPVLHAVQHYSAFCSTPAALHPTYTVQHINSMLQHTCSADGITGCNRQHSDLLNAPSPGSSTLTGSSRVTT